MCVVIGGEGVGMWDLIVLVLDHCLSFSAGGREKCGRVWYTDPVYLTRTSLSILLNFNNDMYHEINF